MSTLPISTRRAVIVAVLLTSGILIGFLPVFEGVEIDGRTLLGCILVGIAGALYEAGKARS